MAAQYHLPEEWLIDYAAGSLDEAASVIVASHLALCPDCRRRLNLCEATGGALLEKCEELKISSHCRDAVMAALDGALLTDIPITPLESLCRILPSPIRSFSGCGFTGLCWQRVNRKVQRVVLPTRGKGRLELVQMKANSRIPFHSHRGDELTLVLMGSLRDQKKLYRRGDVMFYEDGSAHSSKIGAAEACICLIYTDHPHVFKGIIGRALYALSRRRVQPSI